MTPWPALVCSFLAQSQPADSGSDTSDGTPGLDSLSQEEMVESILSTLLSIWQEFLGHLPLLFAGIFVLVATWLVSAVFGRMSSGILSRFQLRGSLRELIRRLVHLTLWALGITVAAMVVFPGLTPTRALAGLGLSSIAVGFAFKDIFENFFAGILILWRFPFENGDFVECKGILGRLEAVTIRNTLIRKTTGELVVVPNATIFKNPVDVLTNWDKRRVTVICGVAYGENVDDSRTVIEEAVKKCETVDRERPVEIFAREFNSSSIDFEVTWWSDPSPTQVRQSRDQVVAAVKAALDDAGIEIPFPYRTLTFKERLEVSQHAASSESEPRRSQSDARDSSA